MQCGAPFSSPAPASFHLHVPQMCLLYSISAHNTHHGNPSTVRFTLLLCYPPLSLPHCHTSHCGFDIVDLGRSDRVTYNTLVGTHKLPSAVCFCAVTSSKLHTSEAKSRRKKNTHTHTQRRIRVPNAYTACSRQCDRYVSFRPYAAHRDGDGERASKL